MRCMLESPGAPTAHLCVDGWPSEVPGRGAVAPWPCWGVGLVHLSLGFKHFRLGDESNMI